MQRRRTLVVASAILAATTLASIAAAGGGARRPATVTVDGVRYTVTAVRPTRTGTGQVVVARTDRTLLGLRSSRPVPILIKLADPALAVQLERSATRAPLRSGRRAGFLRKLAQRDRAFANALAAAVPGAEIGRSLRVVYGGIAAVVPGNAVRTILRLPGVVAVQRDVLRRATAIGNALPTAGAASPGAADPTAGAGIVVATIDSGIWPEHPALADTPALTAPRPTRSGGPRICNFGDNPTTDAVDPFLCGRKVLGGDVFLDRYRDAIGLGGERFPTSARDGDGHGTATATIAAGDLVAGAPVSGIDRGPFAGVAPGASLLAYKALSRGYGYDSDIVAAIDRAVADGADLIVLPISSSTGDPATDPVALALLDATAAGVSVIASAGNHGPGDGTVENAAPWVTTVGSTSASARWQADVTLVAGADALTLAGAGAGPAAPPGRPVVVAGALAGYAGGADCHAPARTDQLDRAVVVCAASNGTRAAQGRNVLAGGAAGVVFVDVAAPDPTANVLPAVTLDGEASDRLRGFLAAHADAAASIAAASPVATAAGVVSAFSGRGGPRSAILKPEVVAPGEGLLAGTTPAGDATSGGPLGGLYSTLTGTSAATAVAAGDAAVVRSLHPAFTPAEVRSALATTAGSATEGGVLATPFAAGSGAIDLAAARNPGLVLDVAPADLAAATTTAARIALNLPSVLVPAMPASATFVRTARNIAGVSLTVSATLDPIPGVLATVTPAATVVPVGGTVAFTIAIDASAVPDGLLVGALRIHAVEPVIVPAPLPKPERLRRVTGRDRGHHEHGGGRPGSDRGGDEEDSDDDGDDDDEHGPPPPPPPAVTHDLHLPIVAVRLSAPLGLAVACLPATLVGDGVTPARCTVAVPNPTAVAGVVHVHATVAGPLRVATATGATVAPDGSVDLQASLSGPGPDRPIVARATRESDPGYLDLSLASYAVAPTPIGLGDALELSGVGSFVFAGRTWDRLSVLSNGAIIAGGGATIADRKAAATAFPDVAMPNAVLAPFWSALDGTGAPGIRVARLTSSGRAYLVVQWDVRVAGTTSPRTFEVWIGQNGTEDIVFAYDQARLPAAVGLAGPLSVGAENAGGTAGDGLGLGVAPVGDLRVSSAPGNAPVDVGFSFEVVGTGPGDGLVTTVLDLLGSPGQSVDRRRIPVTAR